MTSRAQFVWAGIKQAGLCVGGLLLLAGVGLLITFPGVMPRLGLIMLFFAVSVLCGPVPPLLTLFDVSDKQLQILCLVLIIPYWVCLGGCVGFLRREVRESNPESDQPQPAKQNLSRLRLTIGFTAFVLGACAFPFGPINTLGPHFNHGSYKNSVINNLRQIDAAKQQLGLEKGLSPSYTPTEAELAPYLGRLGNSGISRIGPERYVIDPLNKPPYAVLDSDWRIRRRGWREGYTIPKQEFRLQ